MGLGLNLTFSAAMAGLVISLPGPASATPMSLFIGVGAASATYTDAATPNSINVSNLTLGGVTISFAGGQEQLAPAAALVNNAFSIVNSSNSAVVVTLVLNGQGFVGPSFDSEVDASGTWDNTPGSVMTYKWYNDPNNGSAGPGATSTPGTLVGSYASPAAGLGVGQNGDNYLHTGVFTPLTNPDINPAFSMTEEWTVTLDAGGELVGGTEAEYASVPEPASLFVLGLGLTGLCIVRRRMRESTTQDGRRGAQP
jgi:hypothetical protein